MNLFSGKGILIQFLFLFFLGYMFLFKARCETKSLMCYWASRLLGFCCPGRHISFMSLFAQVTLGFQSVFLKKDNFLSGKNFLALMLKHIYFKIQEHMHTDQYSNFNLKSVLNFKTLFIYLLLMHYS